LDVSLASSDAGSANGLDHQPIGVRIRNALLERIVGGHYKPGDRLVELSLAREFGSSQAPVREALRDLETAGLVTIRPRRGSFVNDYHAQAQHEIYFVRGALEEAAVRLATPRRAEFVAALAEHLDGMREAARTGDTELCLHHSVGFHRVIMRAAQNELLLRMWESLHVELHSRKTILQPNLDLDAVAESHKPILDAVAAGNGDLAARLSRVAPGLFRAACLIRSGAKTADSRRFRRL
jgi:DNA-binding GntR family transcriptional regulator